MKIAGFEILIVEIPMKVSVEHALAERTVARNVLVAAHDTEGRTGWGEACPRSYVTGETVEGARDTLRKLILPELVGHECDGPDAVAKLALTALDSLDRDQQAAFCAVELALLDLAGHSFGISAGEFLGPVRRQTISYSGVIAKSDPDEVRQNAEMLKDFGLKAVKVKVGADLERNLERLEVARDALGDGVELRVDANCAWDVQEAIRQLEVLSRFGIAGVEQPLPADDIKGMQEVTAAGIVPVVADESLASLRDARRLVDERACDIFNVRVSKVGGLLNAGRIHRCAQAAGLECQLGAQVGETGLLSAAGRHYGTRLDGVRWFEGSYDSYLLETAVTTPDITAGRGGEAPAIEGPGLGVGPIEEALDDHTVQRIAIG